MSPEDYAAQVKEKYGDGYTRDGLLIRDLDDRELVKRMVQRYPADAANIIGLDAYLSPEEQKAIPPPTDVQKRAQSVLAGLGIGVVKGAVNPLVNTGRALQKGVQETAGRALEAVLPMDKEEIFPVAPAPAEPEGTPEKVGAAVSSFVQLLVPELFLQKALTATKIPTIGKGAIQVAKDTGIAAAQSGGDLTETAVTAAASAATRPLAPAVNLLGNMLKRTAGLASGRGTDVIEQILKTPEAARKGLRGDPLQTLKKSALEVINHTKNVGDNARAAFKQGVEEIQAMYKLIPDNPERLRVREGAFFQGPDGHHFKLSMKDMRGFLNKGLNEFRVVVSPNGEMSFNNSSLLPGEEAVMKKVVEKMKNWTDVSPVGINTLADVIRGYAREEVPSMKRANAIIWATARGIDDYLGEQIPKFKKLNAAFAESMRYVEELHGHLGALGRADSPAEVKRVATKIQNLFNANKGMSRQVLESLPGGREILGTEAGRQMSSDIPRSTASIGDKITGLMNAVLPPKAIGEIAAAMSISRKEAQGIFKKLNALAPAARAAFLETIRQMSSEE